MKQIQGRASARSRSPHGRSNLDTRRTAWGRSESQPIETPIQSPKRRTGKIFNEKKNPYGPIEMRNTFPPPQKQSRRILTKEAPSHGLDTSRISHELEWDDVQADEPNMTSARLRRAKTIAAHNLARNLHEETWDNLDELKNTSADELVDKLTAEKNFAKHYRTLKYKDRSYANQSSSKMGACLERPVSQSSDYYHLPSVGGTSSPALSRIFSPTPRTEFLTTKPYMDLSRASTGSRTVSELKYGQKLEQKRIGEEMLRKDESYMAPGVSFKRVNAFYRDSYVGRDGVTPVSDPYVGRMSLMKA
mmetsp:Transcript_16989/g.22072  ORF Transcript_16989/g.22072 Transcript_16989/m.22072 type:complete len:304 (-) Transcript_16989:239-1150(-)